MVYAGLIAGLGNPGARYMGTRHNFGWMVAEALLEDARQHGGVPPRVTERKTCRHFPWRPDDAAPPWLVVIPLTYMNLSGEAVGPLCRYHRIPPDRLVVAHDDLDLALGRLKFKFAGGTAGHNGLKSIVDCLGTRDFHRLRLGIGRPQDNDGAAYVLSSFTSEERPMVRQVVAAAVQGLTLFALRGVVPAMQLCNGFDGAMI